jgi:enoyl-CoA hydratase/carnithine racemase
MSGEEAFQCGLVNRLVPKEKLLETAEEMAKKIASYDSLAVRNAKQAVVRGLDLPLMEGLELEKRFAFELRLRTGKAAKIKKGKR